MKKSILLFSLLSIPLFCFSQNGNFDRQFGVDGSELLSRFIGVGSSSTGYFFTYRKFGEEQNTRYGLGGSFFWGGGGDAPTSLDLNNLVFRAGKERYKDFAGRWRGFYGWDFKGGLGFNIGDGSDFVGISLGPSAFFGLQFRINERLSISTEASYDFLVSFLIRDETDIGVNGFFNPPSAIYVNYDFVKKAKNK